MNRNQYFNIFLNTLVIPFRRDNKSRLDICMSGLDAFINANDNITNFFDCLKNNDIFIEFNEQSDSISEIRVKYKLYDNNELGEFNLSISGLPSLIELTSKTDIPVSALLIIRIISKVICKYKILYKALALDLDETLWPGVLSEDGLESINKKLRTEKGVHYIAFMKFVKILAEELGVFVAICSRNDILQVKRTIEALNEDIFPLKDQIDYIIANNNAKSENIKEIASQLSILPRSIVFIDDNQIERDEVRRELPDVFVPNWRSHSELITQLNAACIFERSELSLNSRNRRKQYRIIQTEKKKRKLPTLYIKIGDVDSNNEEAKKLYAKSNQFKLISADIDYENSSSIIFRMYEENGDSLGICSVITYSETNILNWAISCRFFEIGLEEFIIIYMLRKIGILHFVVEENDDNEKVQQFIKKYRKYIITDNNHDTHPLNYLFSNHYEKKCDHNLIETPMKMRVKNREYKKYSIRIDNETINQMTKNTNLKLKK